MARKMRIQYEGAIHHVTIRGVERRIIFNDTADYKKFIDYLKEAVKEYGIRLYLFCLMRNHAHFVVETPHANLSDFMQKLQTAYTVYYNRRHKRVGHLMQGRYYSKVVEGDEYLLRLSRYIHLNPVYVGYISNKGEDERIRYLKDYRWSSYRGYAGYEKGYEFVEDAPILSLLRRNRKRYRKYVERGIRKTDEQFEELMKKSVWGIGEEEFQENIKQKYIEMLRNARKKEDISFRKIGHNIPSEEVIGVVAKEFKIKKEQLLNRSYGCIARAVASAMLVRYCRFNQREVAEILGMGTGSAVCHQLRFLREQQGKDKELVTKIKRVEDVLNKHERKNSIFKG